MAYRELRHRGAGKVPLREKVTKRKAKKKACHPRLHRGRAKAAYKFSDANLFAPDWGRAT
jgi:hypothetical protein